MANCSGTYLEMVNQPACNEDVLNSHSPFEIFVLSEYNLLLSILPLLGSLSERLIT